MVQVEKDNRHLPTFIIPASWAFGAVRYHPRTFLQLSLTRDERMTQMGTPLDYGVVVIGRNEGTRLTACLDSITNATSVIYVDSGSIDGSAQMARRRGIDVVELDLERPFTAARARNAGLARLRQIHPWICYVQFVDGDCKLNEQWPQAAIALLEARPDVAAVSGRLREMFPERSVYNWLCDLEWKRPVGEVTAFAGNVMMRVNALRQVSGYREALIAGEESELCVRLRGLNWKILSVADEMALHDAAMLRFGQWWRRSMRGGYAFAQGSDLHGHAPDRHFVRETRRAWIWGLVLPLACLIAALALFPSGLLLLLLYPLQLVRLVLRNSGSPRERMRLSFFQLLARFPETLGVLCFQRDKWFRRQARIIEHKAKREAR
jgi:GT2 family glycosyltransferase